MSQPSQPLYLSLEFTPNPNTLKYSVNRTLTSHGAANFTTLEQARTSSPLAAKLFEVTGIAGVMIGKDFVTITKTQEADWDKVHTNAQKTLEDYLRSSLPLFTEDFLAGNTRGGSAAGSETENKIREILDREIRPAVAMDGGDVMFDRFEDGVVYLHMQGSCAGCPSSTMTLKMGIETRLREALPEIKEVVSVA